MSLNWIIKLSLSSFNSKTISHIINIFLIIVMYIILTKCLLFSLKNRHFSFFPIFSFPETWTIIKDKKVNFIFHIMFFFLLLLKSRVYYFYLILISLHLFRWEKKFIFLHFKLSIPRKIHNNILRNFMIRGWERNFNRLKIVC
jgi:hypothetical protein